MQTSNPRHRNIRDIALEDNDSLSQIYKHSLALLSVQEKVRSGLGPILGPHLFIASLTDKTMVIFTDNPIWTTRLRSRTPDILSLARLATKNSHLETVRIRVNPGLAETPASQTTVAGSREASRLLAEVAATISDEPLKTVLMKLSGSTRKS